MRNHNPIAGAIRNLSPIGGFESMRHSRSLNHPGNRSPLLSTSRGLLGRVFAASAVALGLITSSAVLAAPATAITPTSVVAMSTNDLPQTTGSQVVVEHGAFQLVVTAQLLAAADANLVRGGGTVTVTEGGWYPTQSGYGTADLRANASRGFVFSHWLDATGTLTSYQGDGFVPLDGLTSANPVRAYFPVGLPETVQVTAVFVPEVAPGVGGVTVTGTGGTVTSTTAAGTTTFMATPGECHTFASWAFSRDVEFVHGTGATSTTVNVAATGAALTATASFTQLLTGVCAPATPPGPPTVEIIEIEVDAPATPGAGAGAPGAGAPGAAGPGAAGPGVAGPGAADPGAAGPGAAGAGAGADGAADPGAAGPGADGLAGGDPAGPGADGPGADGPGAGGPGAPELAETAPDGEAPDLAITHPDEPIERSVFGAPAVFTLLGLILALGTGLTFWLSRRKATAA